MKAEEKISVFVVENSKMFSSWIVSELEKIDGLNLSGTAETQQVALRTILELKPQIVILDILLDNGTGLGILQTIREQGLPTKVIVFSNFNFYKDQCMKLGSDYFYDKSNEFEEMISTVKSLCEKNPQL